MHSIEYVSLKSALDAKGISSDQLRDRLALPVDAMAWITGSIAAGHGTPQSDIDLHVALPLEIFSSKFSVDEQYEPLRSIELWSDGRVNYDIEYLVYEELLRAATNVAGWTAIPWEERSILKRVSDVYTTETVLGAFHRIATGVELVGTKAQQVQDSIRTSNYYYLSSALNLNRAEGCYTDIVGFLEIGDNLSAKLLSQELILLGAEAFVAANGISIDRRKWVPWALRQIPDDPVAVAIMEFIAAEAGTDRNVDGMLSFYDRIQDAVAAVLSKGNL